METILTSEGNFLTKTKNEKGNFKVAYSYGSHTGNVWTNWYECQFNSLFDAIDEANNIIQQFNEDNESYSRSRLDLYIEKE